MREHPTLPARAHHFGSSSPVRTRPRRWRYRRERVAAFDAGADELRRGFCLRRLSKGVIELGVAVSNPPTGGPG